MKRNFLSYLSFNLPDFISHLAHSIINKNNCDIIIDKDIGDDIDNPEDIIYNLNIILENKLIKIYENKKDIQCIYKYNDYIFELILKYNNEREKYKISCIMI